MWARLKDWLSPEPRRVNYVTAKQMENLIDTLVSYLNTLERRIEALELETDGEQTI